MTSARTWASGLAVLATTMVGAAQGDWVTLGGVTWQRGAAPATRTVPATGSGPVRRCLVEPAPGTTAAGLAFGGWQLTLGGAPGEGGFALTDAAGKLVWSDPFVDWTPYTPYLLEAVVDGPRTRVQMLAWDRRTLLSQSDWLDAAPSEGELSFVTRGGPARFYAGERAAQPSSPLVADAPNKLRLIQSKDSDWRLVGPANWTWTTRERKVLRQASPVNRTTAVCRTLGGTEGTWRCRVKVNRGTGGSGLLLTADEALQNGFNCWLGGQHGNGGLMLYRLPGEALWSSPQGRWHYDTEYLLELTIGGGQVSCRQLAADGTTVLAASPKFDLRPAERGVRRSLGLMTWLGGAEFRAFSDQTAVVAGPAATSPLGPDWAVTGGTWRPVPGGVAQVGTEPATALWLKLQGAQATWRCDVTPGTGCRAVALVFQAEAQLKEGFLCRLGEQVRLESLDGRVLWRQEGVTLQAGRRYRLEGHVETDRVRLRVLDANGQVLAESSPCFISDRNNTRTGVIGVRTEGGPARFEGLAVE